MLKQVARASAAVTNNDTSDAVSMKYVEKAAVQINISNGSTPNGAVKLQGSNDNSNWVDISGATDTITDDTDKLFNLTDIGYEHLRAFFTVTSGSFDAEVLVSGKERKV